MSTITIHAWVISCLPFWIHDIDVDQSEYSKNIIKYKVSKIKKTSKRYLVSLKMRLSLLRYVNSRLPNLWEHATDP